METKVQHENTSKWKYVWKHKLVLFLFLLIIVGAGWGLIKYYLLNRSFRNEKRQITSQFVDETSKVFSWAIRGELLRDNREQVNQFFMDLVKEPGFRKIQLVDVNNSTIIVSTDKKDEGAVVSDTAILNASKISQQTDGEIIRSITPVMGLNSRIAVLVIDRTIPVQNDKIQK